MKNTFLIIISLLCVSCVQKKSQYNNQITQAIPIKSNLIIKFHNINKTYQKLTEMNWWKDVKEIEMINEKLEKINRLHRYFQFNKIFNNRELYLSFMLIGEHNSEFLLTTSILDIQSDLNKLLMSKFGKTNKQKVYEGITINHIKLKSDETDDFDMFYFMHDGLFVYSLSEILIQASIRQLHTNTNLFKIDPIAKLDQNLPKYSDLNILVKTEFLEKMIGQKNIFLNSDTWSCFDVELEDDNILLNGVTNRGDIKYLKDNKYSDAKQSSIEQFLPRHIKGFYTYSINNDLDLNEVMNIICDGPNANSYHLSYNEWEPKEISIAYDDNLFTQKSYLIFNPNLKKKCINDLTKYHQKNLSEKYLKYHINLIEIETMGENNWLKVLLQKWEQIYYTIINDHVIMSDSNTKIQSLINNTIANQTIGLNKSLQVINEKMGEKSHTSFYLNFQNHNAKWKKIFNSVVSRNIGSENYFFNSLIFLHENERFSNLTAWNFHLQHETDYKPQIVTNHYTKDFEVITQDIENNIYLITKDGKEVWTKKIGNAIIGDVHQIDAYKNNKLQYLFNTKDSIYLIDRNGNNVSGFPIKTKKQMSIPLAIFDYDNTKKYRILVAMENELVMYNQRGELVSGWEFTNTNTKVNITPEHIQVFDKDYIIISEESGKMHLLNRKGQSRLSIAEKIHRNHKLNLIKGTSLDESKLILKNNTGKIISIDFRGQIDTLAIQNLKNDDVYITNKDFTIIVKNKKLTFSSKKTKFEYNFKTKPLSVPKWFSSKKTNLVAIKNKSENLIYMLNEKGELHAPPFFGTTDFSVSHNNLIVGSHEGLIYNYKFN